MMQTDFTGRTLGGYRILRKLGQGGMAVVYKAHEESLNRVVALKVIAQHLAENAQFIERFKREAQAAAQLSHPNIVQIYAIGEDDGVHFFSMEYVKGRSLGEIIEKEGFLTAGRALPIIQQAAEALAVAHEAGIVHRDIKPGNIMLDDAGRVKVADFGIAQMSTETRMTQSGMLVGTPEYISPEQCRNEKLDGRSDIYALGVTLYQLLSGRTPFEADTPASLVLQIVEGPIPTVGSLNPTIPTDVQSIVAKMMHLDRNKRFQSAEDLVHAIDEADTQPATGAGAVPAGAAPEAAAEPTVAMGDSSADPTVAMPPGSPAAAPHGEVADAGATPEETEAIPTQQAVPVSRPSPATDAYAGGGGNRGTVLGIAALVLVTLALAFIAWQIMGRIGVDETLGSQTNAHRTDPSAQDETANASTGNEATVDTDAKGGLEAGDPEFDDSEAGGSDVEGVLAVPAASAQPTVEQTEQPATAAPGQQATMEALQVAPPPINSIVSATSGEYAYIDLVNTWFEGAFADQQFEVVDFQSSPYEAPAEAARFRVVTSATILSTQQLEYFGNVQTQYTVSLTTRVIDLSDGVTVVGPESTTLRYTSTNMEQNLERGATDLARSTARTLRELIRTP